MAVAHQPEPERGARVAGVGREVEPEQRRLEAIGAPGTPGGGHDPRHELGLEDAFGRELGARRGVEGGKRAGVLVVEEHVRLRAQAVLERIAGGAPPA
jgi:hypothetical protein